MVGTTRDDESARGRAASPAFTTHLAEVVRVARVTPRMVRITVGGAGLVDFRGGVAADERVKVFFPGVDEVAPVVPSFGAGGLVYPEGAAIPHARNYTVVRFDPVGPELDLDFVLHGSGRAAEWAGAAREGDFVGIAGPLPGAMPPDGVGFVLLAGDEAALPGIASVLERLAPGTRAHAIVEVADAAEEQALDVPEGGEVRVQWVHRDTESEAGGLVRAVRSLTWPATGSVYAWVAGEAGVVRDIRRHLRDDRGLGRADMHVSGYWRRGRTVEQWLSEEPELLGDA